MANPQAETGVIYACGQSRVAIQPKATIQIVVSGVGQSVVGHIPQWVERLIAHSTPAYRGPPAHPFGNNQLSFNF